MNILHKIPNIKTQAPADSSEKKPEASLVSVEAFLGEPNNPIKSEHYTPLELKNEGADQSFLQALSITPLRPQANFSFSSSFEASSLITSTNVIIDLRPSATDLAPIDSKELAHVATGANAQPDDAATAKTETIAPAEEKLIQLRQASDDMFAKVLHLETPKTHRSSPELTAQEIILKPEKNVLKDISSLPSISKNPELANSISFDSPKISDEATTPVGPRTNFLSDTIHKAPQAVSLISAPTSVSNPALQTVAQTLVKAQETQSGISVRLDPPEMGRVFIDFKFEADRSVTAIIRSEIAETAILLRDKAEFFQQTLRDSGFDSINLSFQQNDHSEQKAFDSDYTEKALDLFHPEQNDDDAIENTPSPSNIYMLSQDTAIDIKL